MKRVLVIDDDPPVARLITAALGMANIEHTLEYCSDGGQGRVKASQGGYDLIALDIHMPLMGGVEALAEMKRDPKSAAIPVVIVTAEKDPGFHKRVLDLGAAVVVTKPFETERLSTILNQVLSGKYVEPTAGVGTPSDLRPLDE